MNRPRGGRTRRRTRSVLMSALLVLGSAATATTVAGSAKAAVSHQPFGHYDRLAQIPGGFAIAGWAIDPDTTAPINVDIYVDGRGAKRVLADRARLDVARRYPGHGVNHGFAVTLPRAAGPHTICAFAINTRLGRGNTPLGCRQITLNYNPTGKIARLAQTPGGFAVSGYAFDPDSPRTALTVSMSVDGVTRASMVADKSRADVALAYPYAGSAHGFLFASPAAQGSHKVCITATNIMFGTNAVVQCNSLTLNFNPTAVVTSLTQTTSGARVRGWAQDPDTTKPVTVVVSADGGPGSSVVADDAGATHSGHNFTLPFLLGVGTHTICATARNLYFGTADSPKVCQSITLSFDPIGRFEKLTRATATSIAIGGTALDPSTVKPIQVRVKIDGRDLGTITADKPRPDVEAGHPGYGANHGFAATYPVSDWKHTVCLTALNVGTGTDRSLGCKIIYAVHPVPPSAPRAVAAEGGFGGATVTWSRPASDGGAPLTGHVVTSYPSGITVQVAGSATSATVMGLKPSTLYSFKVVARNVAGLSTAGISAAVRTQASPPPQTSPAPVSTSRYIRNIRYATATELNTMRAEGIADARANPSGHGYLMLLDIGGQDSYRGGVVLSATTRFVSYANLVACIKAYVAGYASAQRPSAPAVIAIGTNNDMDVSTSTGVAWAKYVVNPVRSWAVKYLGIKIAGANDIEPGFRATYTQTRAWLSGYLSSTNAAFVFNGSADGCSWTATRRGCNNGWTMHGLYQLAAGAAPTRTLNLPQIYNYTMAAQWKYISLTGISYGRPRIYFAGPLTEWTACYQARSCGSLTGKTAWSALWAQLQSSTHLRVASLPYSTDLRIDR